MAELWEEKIPYNDAENTYVPQIMAYPANSKGAVIVFPGGGYGMKADHEGPVIGEWLQAGDNRVCCRLPRCAVPPSGGACGRYACGKGGKIFFG